MSNVSAIITPRGRRLIRIAAVAALVVGATALVAAPAQADGYAPPASCSRRILQYGFGNNSGNDRFHPGEFCLYDGTHKMVFQSDGNLVYYSGSKVIWATYTSTKTGYLALQTDGNVVIYSGGSAVWQSHTYGHGYEFYEFAISKSSGIVGGYNSTGPIHTLWSVG